VAQLLNEYLETMTRAVFDNGGTVDKLGDAILAIFGAPEELKPNEQVRRAIATARAMHHSPSLLNQRWLSGFSGTNRSAPVQSDVAFTYGSSGMFSAKRSDYTAIGPSVNIAAHYNKLPHPVAFSFLLLWQTILKKMKLLNVVRLNSRVSMKQF